MSVMEVNVCDGKMSLNAHYLFTASRVGVLIQASVPTIATNTSINTTCVSAVRRICMCVLLTIVPTSSVDLPP